jgi:hypothetical protein
MLAAAAGFTPPPRWEGAPASFAVDHNTYASSDGAARRWLTPAIQQAITEYNQLAAQRVSLRVYQGMVEARWARDPLDVAQINSVLALLELLRRQQRPTL